MGGNGWIEAHKKKPWNKTCRGRRPKGKPISKAEAAKALEAWLVTNKVTVVKPLPELVKENPNVIRYC